MHPNLTHFILHSSDIMGESESDTLYRESDSFQAIEAFDTLAGSEALRLDYWLEAGDIQILNNHQIVHTRTHYEDWEVS